MDFFTTIKDNLLRYYMVCVPPIVIEELKKTVYNGIIPEHIVNKLLILENKNEGSTDLNDFSILKLIAKQDIFESNIFQLFEAKNNLAEEHFKVLLDTYRNHVEGHVFATEWMSNYVAKTFKELDITIINLYKLQAKYFDEHQNELITHFEIQTNKAIKANSPTLEQLVNDYPPEEIKVNVPSNDKKGAIKMTKAHLKKQKLIIDDNEIDRFLLSTVFNVDL